MAVVFDLPFAPAELLAGDFGAVVFAISLFLSILYIGRKRCAGTWTYQKDEQRSGYRRRLALPPLGSQAPGHR
jgi:hypothetical protein